MSMNNFRTFNPCTLLAPVPAVMVSCKGVSPEDRPNIITIAWAGTVNSEPPMVSVSVRKNRYSHALIRESGEFVVNLVDQERCRAVDFCGVRSGKDVDKWKECGLTPMKAIGMDGLHTVEQPPIGDCTLTQAREVLDGILAKKTADYFEAMRILGMDSAAVKEYVKEWKV